MKEAALYKKLEDDYVRCNLCSHYCRIGTGERGKCGVRENVGGTLFTLVYDKVAALHVDPIEKKPLFHFYPGSTSLSVATMGCNFSCVFCQNADLSQVSGRRGAIRGDAIPPTAIVELAKRERCRTVSYTYTEPTIFMELAEETARLAQEVGILNVFVTNGFMTKEALDFIDGRLDAANVDLKSFREEFYERICGARLKPVLRSIERMKAMGVWVEVTTLAIPGENDSDEEMREIAGFLYKLDPDIPWHISRFHPMHKMLDRNSTPIETLERARQIGLDVGLRYVYCGNVPGADRENTFCASCGTLLVRRLGFRLLERKVRGGKCVACGAHVAGAGW